jgi:HAD superfamily hydrolase (TIGR01490 family)
VNLTLFDLDHTLLSGDSDVLWCDYLMQEGLLDRATFAPRNAQMEAGYKAGTVDAADFAGFYVSTLAGRTPTDLEPVRRAFLAREVLPRIPQAARDLVDGHRRAGDLVVMTTATNRYITELTAATFGIEHLIATEVEIEHGWFTGLTRDLPNMREGKVTRLATWLAGRGLALDDCNSTAYSDSINDLPLLEAVNRAVAVDPDPRLEAVARKADWPVLRLR